MHSSTNFESWYQVNQRYSFAAFDLVHNLLQNFIERSQKNPEAKYLDIDRDRSIQQRSFLVRLFTLTGVALSS